MGPFSLFLGVGVLSLVVCFFLEGGDFERL